MRVHKALSNAVHMNMPNVQSTPIGYLPPFTHTNYLFIDGLYKEQISSTSSVPLDEVRSYMLENKEISTVVPWR